MKNQEELDTPEKWVEKWQDKFQFALEYAKFYIWFPRAVANLAVSGERFLVASGNCWYEVAPSLAWKEERYCEPQGSSCGKPVASVNKLLLPFGRDRLLTCWTQPRGVCYVENLTDGSSPEKLGDELVTYAPKGAAAGLLFCDNCSDWSLVVATTHKLNKCFDDPSASLANKAVFLIKVREKRVDENSQVSMKEVYNLHFEDAFRWQKHFFFPYWHNNGNTEAKMLIARYKENAFQHNSQLLRCGAGSETKVLSSAYLEQRGLWAGIFGSASGPATPTSTSLCIFALEELLENAKSCSFSEPSTSEFHSESEPPDTCIKVIWPINNSTSLSHFNLVSVYATVLLKKIVLFLGTGNGQLLKIVLDDKMKPNCPDILYEIKEETPIFHRLELDPTDQNYIYLPSNNMIRRIQVANCSKYISCRDCLSAMDPHCGWCHTKKSCTLKGECSFSSNSPNWVNISYSIDKCLKIYTSQLKNSKIRMRVDVNSFGLSEAHSRCKMLNIRTNEILCDVNQRHLNCSCDINFEDRSEKVQVSFISGTWKLSEIFEFDICSLSKTCSECNHTHCTWNAREKKCVISTMTCAKKIDCSSAINALNKKDHSATSKPIKIISIEPNYISTLGKPEVLVIGENFTKSNFLMEITGTSSCQRDVGYVTKVLNDTHMKFCLPPSRKEVKSACIKENGFECSASLPLRYVSFPSCSEILPNNTWMRGGRNVTIHGKYLSIADEVILSDFPQNLMHFTCYKNNFECSFTTPAVKVEKGPKIINIILKVKNINISCVDFQYYPDPKFLHYELITDLEPDLELKIHKKKDNLNLSRHELEVFLSDNNLINITFNVQNISKTATRNIIHCRARQEKNLISKINKSSMKVYVKVGNFVYEVPNENKNYSFFYILLLIPIVIVVAFFVTQRKSKQLNRKLSEHLELLECELRKEIREGFVELQVEKLDIIDSFGTIPFLDYKHFVHRTFFPETIGISSIFIEDSNEPLSKDQGLYALICNKHFLVTLIHILEKQKTFDLKDRCLFASFLTIALQTNLVYLTNILEVLTKDLMEQSSNIQPKLMLRRTESVVEKLLTNWMSVCLSGFLRETVGEPFFLLVTTLNQRIIKGPVDVITCKALYTLNEDWLLWQAPEFSTVVLNVVFENIQENEASGATQNIQVKVLDCDTIGQAKEKILQAFLNKNGSLYGLQLGEMGLTVESVSQEKELLDVDGSSVILENGVTKLNTIGHYEISDGAKMKVFKKKQDISADGEYSEDYCHLILPDAEAAKETQSAKHKGKQKFKVKEMYLTKLLSTKVAIHSTVEKLFRSIWNLPNNKAPVAIKYFFDFLDAQAENKKITDPDVVHIWKTNSLPLRFWVNILKNPQFVFDIKKTPHIDGCLSVIAQAFMDAFSLSEQQLGKEAPTNKLLYAKDIPLYKEEVKAFYKAIRDLPPLSRAELEEFLILESQKHENEFNETEALNKIYQYITRYFDKILNKLETERGFEEARQQLLNIKGLMDEKKKCKWV
ncbi:plexin-C1 [Protobothrops mucrosquamatus]|uniref:plexin-C1 n=1 Tax=Protobothrops mucrosquamatus TaxID=103944 RepID=UPI0010FB30A7|nr:plexin-C1 [Protobothrops mucrosquamatus]